MKTFRVKLEHLLDEQDFLDHPVWATYYEPDDIDTLVALGFGGAEVRSVLEATGYSDEYSFPLPAEAASSPFHYLYLSVRATTRGGNELVGFLTGACFGVFFQGKAYRFNKNLRLPSLESAAALAVVLGEVAVFPMEVTVVATSENKEVDFW